jgi:hypothetical protein
MATKKTAKAPAEQVALYEKVVALFPEVERKGAGFPYTSLNGNMFSLLNEQGKMVLRLGQPERDAFIAKYKTKLNEAYGIVQKEYVVVPDDLLRKTSELRNHFEASLAYVRSLKAKPRTRPVAKKAAKAKK